MNCGRGRLAECSPVSSAMRARISASTKAMPLRRFAALPPASLVCEPAFLAACSIRLSRQFSHRLACDHGLAAADLRPDLLDQALFHVWVARHEWIQIFPNRI